MNLIIKYDRNFMAISDRIEADRHRHWLLQLFLSSQKDLNIEVNDQRILCSAILVNINTIHMFQAKGEPNFTMLVDPTSELGRRFKEILIDQPFYVFPEHIIKDMQQAFNHALAKDRKDDYLSFARSTISFFSNWPMKCFDDRVHEVLDLLEKCIPEEEVHQLKDLSKKIGLSESRLAHLFKEETGIPLKSYIVLHKLHKAYDSIFKGESITTAALNAGFDSPSHLAYTNKKMTGMSASNIIKDSEFLKVF